MTTNETPAGRMDGELARLGLDQRARKAIIVENLGGAGHRLTAIEYRAEDAADLDPRWRFALAHPEVLMVPPPLFRCGHPGCVNTVRSDGGRCDFHFEGI